MSNMRDMYGCWECGKHAPSGVCPGPHPDFDLGRAMHAQSVTLGQIRVDRDMRCRDCGTLHQGRVGIAEHRRAAHREEVAS